MDEYHIFSDIYKDIVQKLNKQLKNEYFTICDDFNLEEIVWKLSKRHRNDYFTICGEYFKLYKDEIRKLSEQHRDKIRKLSEQQKDNLKGLSEEFIERHRESTEFYYKFDIQKLNEQHRDEVQKLNEQHKEGLLKIIGLSKEYIKQYKDEMDWGEIFKKLNEKLNEEYKESSKK